MYERFQPEGASGPLNPQDPDYIIEGVVYVVTGGGGAPLRPVPSAPSTETGEDVNSNGVLDAGEDLNNNGIIDYPTPLLTSEVAESTFEAMQISVSAGTINVTVIRDDGSTLDAFTINKEPSCPSLYYWNGQEYEEHGFILPDAMPRENEFIDHIVLDNLTPDENGTLSIQIRENEPEYSFIDMVRLIVVDRGARSRTSDYFLKRNAHDRHYTYEAWYNNNVAVKDLKKHVRTQIITPEEATHSSGGTATFLIHNSDDRYVELHPGDQLTVTFPYTRKNLNKSFILAVEGFYMSLVEIQKK